MIYSSIEESPFYANYAYYLYIIAFYFFKIDYFLVKDFIIL